MISEPERLKKSMRVFLTRAVNHASAGKISKKYLLQLYCDVDLEIDASFLKERNKEVRS